MRTARRPIALASVYLLLALPAVIAQIAEPELAPQGVPLRAPIAPPLRLAERPSLPPLVELDLAMVAEVEQLESLRAWNRSGGRPPQVGFARDLPVPREVIFDPSLAPPSWRDAPGPDELAGGLASRTPKGDLVWGAKVRVEGAYRLRLHLSQIDLPVDARFWVYGDDGETVGPFGLELLGAGGGLWTPSVAGPTVHLEAVIPGVASGSVARFVIDRVVEAFRLDETGAPISNRSVTTHSTDCLIDAQCVGPGRFGAINQVQQAIALIRWIEGGRLQACTGGLVADKDPTTVIPYLLTANHCFSTQSATSTLEAFWDYYTSSCNGAEPSLASRPRSSGGTLLATGDADGSSDFTFVRLTSIPANRVLLGWNASASAVGSGTLLYRVSHPLSDPQRYSESRVRTPAPHQICIGRPLSRYLYSEFDDSLNGGTAEGASGAPVLRDGGIIVGQLFGLCGSNPSDGCDGNQNHQVDGRFSTTYPSISQYLDPPKYTLTVTKTGSGSGRVTSSPGDIDCGATCSDEFTSGEVVMLTASPSGGSTFAGWSGNPDCSDGQVTMDADKTCTATFNVLQKTLTVSKSGTGGGTVTSAPPGINCGSDCSQSYDLDTVVQLIATASFNSTFEGWSGDPDCLDGTVTMDTDLSCTARFDLLPQYSLSVSKTGGGTGTVTSNPAGVNCGPDCQEDYFEGTVVRLSGTPAVGSELTSWGGDADCSDGRLNMVGARSCTATFNLCSRESDESLQDLVVSSLYELVACNFAHVGPDVQVTATGKLEIHVGNAVTFYDGFEIEPGGELTVIVGQPLPPP